MTFLDPPFPLTQSTEFEVGEILGINTGVNEDDTCNESVHTFIEVYDSDVTLEGRLYVDVVINVPASFDMVDDISPDLLDTLHAFPSCSLPSPSPECHNLLPAECHDMLERSEIDCMNSLGTFRGYGSSFFFLIACT